mmetsp:Transcript_14429/g.36059  ORF Transcript_14429/g.36059 Transcript_14429/m.36059 type:complete len:210 (+) Transcript_14429:1076-1705(+)
MEPHTREGVATRAAAAAGAGGCTRQPPASIAVHLGSERWRVAQESAFVSGRVCADRGAASLLARDADAGRFAQSRLRRGSGGCWGNLRVARHRTAAGSVGRARAARRAEGDGPDRVPVHKSVRGRSGSLRAGDEDEELSAAVRGGGAGPVCAGYNHRWRRRRCRSCKGRRRVFRRRVEIAHGTSGTEASDPQRDDAWYGYGNRRCNSSC